MTDFNQFKNKMLSQGRIDFDHQIGFQCVDLIREWWYENGIINTGGVPTAISYWTHPPQALLNACDRLETSDAHAGDVVVLRTNGTSPGDFSGDGHIGIATGNINANQVEILEQHGAGGNADGLGANAIRTRWVDRARVAGIYRMKSQVAAIPVATAPPAASVPSNKYVYLPSTVQSWTAYHVGSGLRKGTSDVAGILAPAKFGGLRYEIQGWVSDKAVIITTESFGQVAIWVKDTDAQFVDDAPAPAPPAPAPEPPKAVCSYERLPSALNVRTKLGVRLWDLGFTDYADAENNHVVAVLDEQRTFKAVGKATRVDLPDKPVYFMSDESFGDADKTGVPTHNQGVNTVDLEPAPAPPQDPPEAAAAPSNEQVANEGEKIPVKVVPPSPDAWKNTFTEEETGDYTAQASTIIHDLEGIAPDGQLVKGMIVHIAGKFKGPDGVWYRRTVNSLNGYTDDKGEVHAPNWKGIPLESVKEDDGIFTYVDDAIETFKELKGQVSTRRKAVIKTAHAHTEFNWLYDRLKKKGSKK